MCWSICHQDRVTFTVRPFLLGLSLKFMRTIALRYRQFRVIYHTCHSPVTIQNTWTSHRKWESSNRPSWRSHDQHLKDIILKNKCQGMCFQLIINVPNTVWICFVCFLCVLFIVSIVKTLRFMEHRLLLIFYRWFLFFLKT